MLSGENYFLSHWYQKDITDFEIYEKFVEKHLLSLSVDRIQVQSICSGLKIQIPSLIIHDVVLQLTKKYPNDFRLTNDVLHIFRIPDELEKFFREWDAQFKADFAIVHEKFNAFLLRNGRQKSSPTEFQNAVAEIEDSFLYKDGVESAVLSEQAKILSDFVHNIFSSPKKDTLQEKLSRILHSVLVFTYYTGTQVIDNFLNKKILYFDTNILVYFIGANLDFRKQFVTELFGLMKDLGISFVVSHDTLREFHRILSHPPNIEVQNFVRNNRGLVDRFLSNTVYELTKALQGHSIDFTVDARRCKDIKQANPHWTEIESSLTIAKTTDERPPAPASIEHDVYLCFLSDAFKKRESLSEIDKFVLTTDRRLVVWLRDHHRENHLSEYIPFITISRLTLYLWVKRPQSKETFIAHTWMYVAASLRLFATAPFNAVYRQLEQTYYSSGAEEPRSFYLMVKDHAGLGAAETEHSTEKILDFFKEVGITLQSDYRREIQALKSVTHDAQSIAKESKQQNDRLSSELIDKERQITEKDRQIAAKEEALQASEARRRAAQDSEDRMRERLLDLEETDRNPTRVGLYRWFAKLAKLGIFRWLAGFFM